MKLGRKITGGRYLARRKKKKYERKGLTRVVKLSPVKKKVLRTRGGNKKTVLLSGNEVNLVQKNGKCTKAKLKNVLETSANKFLARQNVLVKGAIVETDLGKAKITNRPSQEGAINAILID